MGDLAQEEASVQASSLQKGEILLEARGLSKGFPGVWEHLILDQLDFDVRAGEVHTLLGENGAGKTVIANILSGYYDKTEGEILIRGKPVHLTSPRDGLAHGIAMVHQELMLNYICIQIIQDQNLFNPIKIAEIKLL